MLGLYSKTAIERNRLAFYSSSACVASFSRSQMYFHGFQLSLVHSVDRTILETKWPIRSNKFPSPWLYHECPTHRSWSGIENFTWTAIGPFNSIGFPEMRFYWISQFPTSEYNSDASVIAAHHRVSIGKDTGEENACQEYVKLDVRIPLDIDALFPNPRYAKMFGYSWRASD